MMSTLGKHSQPCKLLYFDVLRLNKVKRFQIIWLSKPKLNSTWNPIPSGLPLRDEIIGEKKNKILGVLITNMDASTFYLLRWWSLRDFDSGNIKPLKGINGGKS